MGVDPLAHLNFFLGALQLVIAYSLTRTRVGTEVSRWAGAALVAANGFVSLRQASSGLLPADFLDRVGAMADLPTPELIVIFVLWFPHPRGTPKLRAILTAALSLLAVIAFMKPIVYPDNGPAWFDGTFGHTAVMSSYAIAIIVLSADFVTKPTWPVQWALSAFFLRGADFAARYSRTYTPWWEITPWLLAGACAFAAYRIGRHSPPESSSRYSVLAFGVGGATLGFVGRYLLGNVQFQESLLTLTLGRPALLMAAHATPGMLSLAAEAAIISAAAYALTAWLSALTGIGGDNFVSQAAVATAVALISLASWWSYKRPSQHRGEDSDSAADRPPDWAVVLVELAKSPPGHALTRSEIELRTGILARNVHRAVEAANRGDFAQPGLPLVTIDLRRGKQNQRQYHYEATDAGRVAAPNAQARWLNLAREPSKEYGLKLETP